ncbi:uncharacterized protein [Antennarius striatus]|uniref:uncharacterized protein n=1 Tax=Antennarius striatus TaxID=241820 RepID=UPI0035AE10E2
MSLTMAKADGVTVFTLTSDPQSSCPPICQILKGLCYSPACCSVSQHLKSVQRTSQSVLGAMHMMVGLINIGLGAILCSSGGGSWWQMDRSLFPFWFGGVYLFLGVMCILSEKCPSPCLVLINVILNLSGVVFAIASIVLYSINIAHIGLWWMCNNYYYNFTPSPLFQKVIKEKCEDGRSIILMMMRSMNAVLIVVSVMEFCVAISSAYFGIKTLRSRGTKENKSTNDLEPLGALLEEATSACRTVKMPKPVEQTKGIKVVSADSDKTFPSLCGVLKALCRQGPTQTSITAALGTMQIMVGLSNIGLGPGRTSISPGDVASLGAAYWLGSVFIVSGILSILAGQFPSTCLMGFTVFMNIAGAIFAITAIVLYVMDLTGASLLWMCDSRNDGDRKENCINVALFTQRLLSSMDVTVIALAVLQLYANIRFAVLGIKALTSEMKKQQTVSVVKHKSVTVVAIASDSRSVLPPLCRILKKLCQGPACCSVLRGRLEAAVVSALGTIQIMVGLVNIGLGPGRERQYPHSFPDLGAAYWLGGVFIIAGISCFLVSRFPTLCLVGFAVLLNIIGSISAVVGAVMYALKLADVSVSSRCDLDGHQRYGCEYVALIAQRLLTAMDITLIVLAVLQLCVCISVAALGIKALLSKKEDEGDGYVEIYRPVTSTTNPAA